MGDWSRFGIPEQKATGDYHDEMTAAHFEEWFHDSLLPNSQSNSLIVMDTHLTIVVRWNWCLR